MKKLNTIWVSKEHLEFFLAGPLCDGTIQNVAPIEEYEKFWVKFVRAKAPKKKKERK